MAEILPILLTIILFYHSITESYADKSEVETVLDRIASQIIQIGDPTHPYEDDINKLKDLCEKYEEIVLTKEKDRMLALFNGMMYKIGKSLLPQLTSEAREGCHLLKKGEGEKAIRIAKSMNQHTESAKKIRYGFQTVLNNAAQNDTNITFPELICYLTKFCDELLALYSDNAEAKHSVEASNNSIWKKIVAVLEEETGKGTTNCKLERAESNPSKYHSIMLPLLQAIDNLERKAMN